MKLHKEFFHHPEVVKQLKQKELRVENTINKFRFIIFSILAAGDMLAWHLKGGLQFDLILGFSGGTIAFFLVMLLIHKATCKSAKPRPWIKYLTISFDYLLIFGGFWEFRLLLLNDIGITQQEFMLIATILFILFNLLSAFRIQKQVLFYSTTLALFLNYILLRNFESTMMITVYSSVFILISGLITIWFSGYIMLFSVANFRLNSAMDELKQANEEITAQRDELESQNEYLQEQRDKIAEQKRNITSSIEYASRIQSALLAPANELAEIFPESFIFYKPKDIVSGDFYWFKEIEIDNRKLKIATVVDCTGHGVPGAFMSMLGTSFLNDITRELPSNFDAAYILNCLRDAVKSNLHQSEKGAGVKDGMDMSLIIIDYQVMEINFAGANNSLFVVKNNSNGISLELEEIKADRMPIGVYVKESKPFTNHTLKIRRGEMLYLFSDGFIDQFGGEKGQKYLKKNFKELLLKTCNESLIQQKYVIEKELQSWMGQQYEQVDDITIMGIRI